MTDRSWDDETIQLFDNLETMLRQQHAEIEALKKANDDYWTMIEILRQRIRGNPLQDRLDEIAAGVVFGKTISKEEILKLAKEFDIWLGDDDIKFIQFVLRKAQEK